MNIIKTWSENTNNAWGFGGYDCTFKEYDNGIIVRQGRYSYRHIGTSSANQISVRIYKGFSVGVSRTDKSLGYVSSLNGIKCVSIFECNNHYLAIAMDVDTLSRDNWDYKLVNKIYLK